MSFNFDKYKKSIPSKKKKKLEHKFIPPPIKFTYPPKVEQHMNRHGLSDNHYEYKNIEGVTQFWMIRYEPGELKNNSKKVILPMSFCEKHNVWEQSRWPDSRCLFQEHLIADRASKDGKEVYVVEGEKAAKALHRRLKDVPVVTFSGGSNSVHESNFWALQNKKVILWPDKDEEGFKAMHHVAKILIQEGITEDLHWIEPLQELPDGWDAADLVVRDGSWPKEALENATAEAIKKMIDEKKEYIPDDEIWKKIDDQDKERKTEDEMSKFIENYVYVRDRKEFYEVNSHKFVDKAQVNDWYAHITKKGMSDLLLRNPDLRKVYSYLTHAGLPSGVIEIKPNQVAGVPPGIYLNNFKPSNIEPLAPTTQEDKDKLKKIIDYFKWLLPNWNIHEQIIAYMIKHPGKKIQWCNLIVSKTEGAGKGLLAQLVQGMLGAHNVEINVSHSQMTGKHMTIIEGKQLIILNEVLISGTGLEKKEITNKMKTLFTDPTIVIEPKGKKEITIPNFCCFWIFSNDEACLHLNRESRRYFVDFIKHKPDEIKKKLEDEGIKDLILEALEGDGIKHLKHYFTNVEIQDEKIFHTRAPITDDMLDMVERSRPEAIRLLDGALEENRPPFKNFFPDMTTKENTVDTLEPTCWIHDEEKNITKSIPQFSGMVIRDEAYAFIKNLKAFRGLYFPLDLFEEWLKEKCIKWPNGQFTKQIIFKDTNEQVSSRPRAYLLKDLTFNLIGFSHRKQIEKITIPKKKLSEMTEGELGAVHQTLAYGVVGQNEFHTIYKDYYDNVNDDSENKNKAMEFSNY